MNIAIITPFYQIEGRPELFQDTCAVHYLVRPWAKEHNVKIIYIYKNYFRNAPRYLRKKDRSYYKTGYKYQTDGVDVFLIEVQRIYRQGLWIDQVQGKRIQKMILDYFSEIQFLPDLIITHMPTETDGMLNGLFRSVPRTAILHSIDILSTNQNLKRYELMARSHDSFFSRSAAIRDYFEKKGLHNLKNELIYSGVPYERSVNRVPYKPSSFRIVYAGKLIKRKHVDLAIQALEKLKGKYSFVFDIYGTGEEEIRIKQLAAKCLGKKCVFHGYVPRSIIMDAMAQSDLFLMASTRETLGLVYIEAMSRGCIPIGVKGEGIDGTIIDGENGFLVEPNSVNDIEQKLEFIFNLSSERYIEIMRNAEKSGCFYNEVDMGRRYLDLILKAGDKEK